MKRRAVAIPQWAEQDWELLALVAQFDDDAEFNVALDGLYASVSDGTGPTHDQLAAIAAQFGLSRLRATFDGEDEQAGVSLLVDWLNLRRATVTAGATYRIPFSMVGGTGGALADEDPTVRISIELAWDPLRETAGRARPRLKAEAERQIRAAVTAGEERTLELGYAFPSERPERHRDLRWLYQRLRHGRTWDQIADAEHDRDVVKAACLGLAKRLRIDATGWGW